MVTGATGFLGSNLTRALVARGFKVRALVRKSSPAMKTVPPEVEIILGDLLDADSLARFFENPDGADLIVLHCAGFVAVAPEWNQRVYDVNVTGTKNMLDQCLRHKVKKLVYISSTGAIPEPPHGVRIRETDHFEPERVVGCYSQTKAMATQLVLDAAAGGLDASVIYPSGIFGPNDYGFSFVPKFIMGYVKGKIPASVDGSFNSVDVRDLANGVIACAAEGKRGSGYIMSGVTVTIHELFEAVRRYAGGPKVRLMLPIPVARLLARAASVISKITKRPALLTTFVVYNLSRNNAFDCSKAVRELGFSCRPFDETVRGTVQWLIAEGKIAG